MIFDDDFLKLTGQMNVDSIEVNDDVSEEDLLELEAPEDTSNVKKWISGSDKKEEETLSLDSGISFDSNDNKYSSEYGNPDFDYVIESDLVTPSIKAKKSEAEKPLIICVDDDFGTLDLLGIYLKRDYEYEGFSGPREAIFFLNQKIPDLILLDCKIHTMKAKTFMEIIMANPSNKDVRFAYTGTEDELAEIDWNFVPDYVIGKVSRPIARGKLQEILDIIKKDK